MSKIKDSGKLTLDDLKEVVFPLSGAARPEVVIGPEFGVDVSMIHLPNGMALLMTSDPLSLIPELGLAESAWLSVHLMANDMSTTGFAPQYGQFVLNLPDTLSDHDFKIYWNHIHSYCSRLGIAITGGHTGKFHGQNSSVCGGGTLSAVVPAESVITSKGGSPGDLLFMTKYSAMTASSILARSFPETILREAGAGAAEEVAQLFYETSAVDAGLIAGELQAHVGGITAMHDVTEKGVLGAAFELASASLCGLEIFTDRIPVTSAQRRVCDIFELYPHHCVGAGSMLITVKPHFQEVFRKRFSLAGIRVTEIGMLMESTAGMEVIDSSGRKPLVPPRQDPYWAAFMKAHQNGWR